MCVSKVQHMTGRKTGFLRFFDFSTNIATGNRKNSECMQPQPVVRSFAVGFSSISVFFPVQQTGPANTSCEPVRGRRCCMYMEQNSFVLDASVVLCSTDETREIFPIPLGPKVDIYSRQRLAPPEDSESWFKSGS